MRERMIRETEEFLNRQLSNRALVWPIRRRPEREQRLVRPWRPVANWPGQAGISV
jgi:hypothetical protein